ncbi:DUF1571 domain-containing protein [Fimbriiglobus ruber]|uniref:DUF1571 domain-containing protein n=1 Tax=Fimbriiglobus ruber TaxID=1908690 RepID=A0A225DN55_9BACT|nr:DUF1571 domain-containing protein [Fimbriiglobus ruber]OWK38876.1 hypothetical protein FRUB_06381 [Fimbriiglobus ruber]
MDTSRSLVAVVLIAAVAASPGCARAFARKNAGPNAVIPVSDTSQTPASPPSAQPPPVAAPKPPAEPSVAPPRADAISEPSVPPLPDVTGPVPVANAVPPINVPPEVPDAPVQRAQGMADNSGGVVSADSDDRRPLKERLEEMRKKREERREQRREDRDPMPLPSLPALPPPSNVKPPAAAEPVPSPTPAAPAPMPAVNAATSPVPASSSADVKQLLDMARARYATVTDFEARMVRREVVNGKEQPGEEVLYKFRKEPLSVYMKTVSENGKGREVLYVKGQFDGKMHVITGKGDNRLVGVGFKTTVDPDSNTATAKSRYRIYEAGFGRTLDGLVKSVEKGAVKVVGEVRRKEYEFPLTAIEVTIRPGDDAMMPKGGKRQIFFDAKKDSPSYLFPVLVVATDADGREVEYYCFDGIKVPSGMKDADWTPDILGKKK